MENRLTTDRISSADVSSLKWHRSCYGWFTNKSHVKRLEKKLASQEREEPIASYSTAAPVGGLRSASSTFKWSLCMFCQEEKPGKTMHNVETFPMSKNILGAAEFDHRLHIALAGCSDLMAPEAKYHLTCYTAFKRNSERTKATSKQHNIALAWLQKELKDSAKKGHILQLQEVWKRYVALCKDAEIDIPSSFESRISTFKEKLQALVSNTFEFHVVFRDSEKCTILIPINCAREAVSRSLDEDDMEGTTIPVYQGHDDLFLSLVHVAMKLRSDILSSSPFEGLNLSRDKILSCIPESLYVSPGFVWGRSAISG